MAVAFAMVLGIALLAIGAIGSISGAHDPDAAALGLNTARNVAQLGFGAVAIVAALASERAARRYCVVFGAVYALAYEVMRLLNLTPTDNSLHLAIAATSLVVGLASQLVGDARPRIGETDHSWRRI